MTDLKTLSKVPCGTAKYHVLSDLQEPATRLAQLYRRQKLGTWPECQSMAWAMLKTLEECDIPAFARRDTWFCRNYDFYPSCTDMIGNECLFEPVPPESVAFDPVNQVRYRLGKPTLHNVCDWFRSAREGEDD